MKEVHKVGDKWAILEGDPVYDTEQEAINVFNRWRGLPDSSIRRSLLGQKARKP